jgi:hypothetical protein
MLTHISERNSTSLDDRLIDAKAQLLLDKINIGQARFPIQHITDDPTNRKLSELQDAYHGLIECLEYIKTHEELNALLRVAGTLPKPTSENVPSPFPHRNSTPSPNDHLPEPIS